MKITVNLYLNPDKRLPGKEKLIYCYIRQNGKTYMFSTGKRIEPKLWDVKNQRGKRQLPSFNIFLGDLKEKVEKICNSFITSHASYSFDDIKKAISAAVNPDNEMKTGFFAAYDEFVEIRKPVVSTSTTKKYLTLKKHMLEFEAKNKVKITFDSIDSSFFEKLINYYFSINTSNNTVRKNNQFLKCFLRWCVERGYTSNDKFEKLKNLKEVETDGIALTLDEIDKIKYCNGLTESLQRVRDVFLFQFYTGQRYSDIEKFDIADVKDNIWHLRQAKTKKMLEIPLFDHAIQILKKYDNILPIISNQKANSYLKEIGELAGITDPVTTTKFVGSTIQTKRVPKYELLCTHTARRSFVSISSYYNINQNIVKSMTGHGSDRMLAKYFKQNSGETLKAMAGIFNN